MATKTRAKAAVKKSSASRKKRPAGKTRAAPGRKAAPAAKKVAGSAWQAAPIATHKKLAEQPLMKALRAEHRHMGTVMQLLADQLKAIESGELVDTHVVYEIMHTW
jgi:hypothetical protein